MHTRDVDEAERKIINQWRFAVLAVYSSIGSIALVVMAAWPQ
ncbi:MAG TPA: hypothetical protein VMM15_05455 [Bradyrhizobium sp.]|nr:hypothetical protein [Bradyrhizobium sp.]